MKLLLHICCAPCLCHPHDVLSREGADLEGYWYNPNIHPYTEYRARRDAVKSFAGRKGLALIWQDEYPLEQSLSELLGGRCQACYRLRLERTAQEAGQRGFSAFSTTLLYSIHQQHDLVRTLGEEIGARHGVPFLYRDFRTGWDGGRRMAREMGLYRQKYCGCIFSERDRYLPMQSAKCKMTGAK